LIIGFTISLCQQHHCVAWKSIMFSVICFVALGKYPNPMELWSFNGKKSPTLAVFMEESTINRWFFAKKTDLNGGFGISMGGKKSPMFFCSPLTFGKTPRLPMIPHPVWTRGRRVNPGSESRRFPSWGYPIAGGFTPCSYGHLPVITGYKWDYTFYKWGFVSIYNW